MEMDEYASPIDVLIRPKHRHIRRKSTCISSTTITQTMHSKKKLCCCGGHNHSNAKKNKHHHGTACKLAIRSSRIARKRSKCITTRKD